MAWRDWQRAVGLVLVFLVAALVLTHPLIWSLGSALPGNLGDPLLNASILGWGAQWLAGERDLWEAPIFHPHPDTLVYSEHLVGVTVFVAPVYWLTGNAILTYNVAVIASFVLAGVAMYLLVEALTGRRDVAPVVALAFAFSPIRMGAQIARLQMLMTGWLPLALWAIHRYGATQRVWYLGWLAISAALLVLSNMYMLLIGALPIGLALAFEVVRARGRRLHLAIGYAVSLGAVALVLAPVVAKYRAVQAAMGFIHDEPQILQYSATVRSYLSVFETMSWLPWVYEDMTADRALYTGGVILLGAIAALVTVAWRRRAANDSQPHGHGLLACYGAISVAALALSFGPVVRAWPGGPTLGTGPYDWLQHLAPSLDGLRSPGRFGIVVAVGLCVIAGVGISRVLSRATVHTRRLVLGAATLLIVVEAWPLRFIVAPFGAHGRPEDQALYAFLRTQPASALLELPASPHLAREPKLTLIHQFETLEHPHALVNGSSGFNSPLADILEAKTSPFTDDPMIPQAVTLLQTVGVRWIAVHTEDYADAAYANRVIHGLSRAPGVSRHEQFGPNHLFELAETDDPPRNPTPDAPRIHVRPNQLAVSHADEHSGHAIDDRLASGWSTGDAVSGAWLRVQLDDSHDVRQVRLELGTAREDWPSSLTIIGTDDEGRHHELYDGPILPRFGVGLVDEPRESPIVLQLPANRSRVVTVRTADESPRVWSVRELELYGWRSPASE